MFSDKKDPFYLNFGCHIQSIAWYQPGMLFCVHYYPFVPINVMKRTTIIFLLCILVSGAFAQDDSAKKPAPQDDSVKKPVPAVTPLKSYFAVGLGYLSNSIYNGRKDSVATPYITPTLGYYDKSGFFVNGSLSYLAKSGSSRIDLFNIAAGYDFDIGNFDGEISANKSFYNSQSTNVKSQITGSVLASGGYDFTFIKPTFEAGINFGTQSDYLLAFGLEHTFYQLKDKLQFTPSFLANGSTQNYYGSYYNKRKVGGKRKKAGITYDVTATVEDASQFKMLDYEFSLPIIYVVKKFSFILTPVFALPVNPALVTTQLKPEAGGNTITRTSLETISNTFYCSFGLTYKL
jgi:hypothetical protein